jgi:MFS family permease
MQEAPPGDSSAPESQQAARRLHGVRLTIVMLALMLSLLLEALDQTVVGTALPRIIGNLHGFDRYTWAVTAYLLASTTMIPLAGKLSDQFGRKWFLLGGIVVFLVASALCGAATTINQLIAFRALQGLGAGVGISLVFTSVADIFPPLERARWQGVLGSVYGVSSVAGPTLGGWLTDHGPLVGGFVTEPTRWRWVFLVNLPLGIVALGVLVAYLPADLSVRSSEFTGWAAIRRIDAAGAVLSVAASICFLVGLTQASEAGSTWSSPGVLATVAAAAILFLVFLVAERLAVEPILPFGLFRNRTFATDAILTVFLYMALFGAAFFVPLFLQGVLGVSPTVAGATMTPFSISIVIGNSLAGLAISILTRYRAVTIVGALLMTAGVLLLTGLTLTTNIVTVAVFVAIAGLGMGILFTATSVAVQNSLPPTHLGVGFGIVRYLGQMGGTIGVAIVGTVVNSSFAGEIGRRLPRAATSYLTSQQMSLVRNPQALLSSSLHATIVRSALRRTVSRVPAGSGHEATVAAATARLHQVLAQVFEALRLSLAISIRHGLQTAVVFCAGAVAASLFLRDAPE